MADSKELLYIIRAKDAATAEIEKVKKSFDKVNDAASGSSKTMGMLSGLLTAEVGRNLTKFSDTVFRAFSDFVDEGAEANRVVKELNQVLLSTQGAAGITAAEVQSLASSMQKVTNFSDETIISGQNMLLTFTKIGKDVFPQATEAMLNMAQKLGTDVPGAAMQLGKALQDPVGALGSLTRMGIRFNDEQERMIRQMVESGNVAGAQRIILGQLETQFGGMATALASSRVQLANSMNDIKEEIGKTLLPAMDSAAKSMLPLIQHLTDWIAKNPELTKSIVFVVGALAGLAAVVGSVLVILGPLAAGLAALGASLAAGGALAVAIGGITALLVVFIQHWEGLKWMAGEAIDTIWTKFTEFSDGVTASIQFVIDKIKAFITITKEAAIAAANLAASLAKAAVKTVVGAVTGRAGGGFVNEDMTLVGENGPELVSLPRGSYVHTARETAGMMDGSKTISVNFGDVHVYKEADEDRLADKVTSAIARMIQLQSLASA